MLTLLIIFYIEQLQSENVSEGMLFVEAEFFTLLGFRTVSELWDTRIKQSKAGCKPVDCGVWSCVCACTCVPACVHNRGTPFRKTWTTELLDFIWTTGPIPGWET